MPLPRFTPVQPQSQPQQGPLPMLFAPLVGLQDVVNSAKPVISGLNANVTAASVNYGQTDVLGTLKIAAFTIIFSTNAVIAAGVQLFTVTFAVPFTNTPIVLVGGGPGGANAFEGNSATPTSFLPATVNSVANAANQGMQFIAIGH